jgi:hypothetical protein
MENGTKESGTMEMEPRKGELRSGKGNIERGKWKMENYKRKRGKNVI